MAASVRIEDEAFGDDRYVRLAHEAGLADADHARGKMARLWRQCTIEQRYHLDPVDVCTVLGERGVEALINARLGEVTARGIRIRGARGRIEWLTNLRKNGAKGGRPRLRGGKPDGSPSGSGNLNPPAPAPAPAQKKKQKGGGFADSVKAFARAGVEELNRLTGKNRDPEAEAVLVDCEKLVAAGHTPEQAVAVVRAKDSEWRNKPDMREQRKPSVIFRPSNFKRYLADIQEVGAPIGKQEDILDRLRRERGGTLVE